MTPEITKGVAGERLGYARRDPAVTNWRPDVGRRWYESLRNQYRPEHLIFLLLGESPPDAGDDKRRFFYSPALSQHDNLYRGVAQAVLEREPGFEVREKEKNLRRLSELGFWLIDASTEPVNHLSQPQRRAMIDAGLPHVLEAWKRHQPEAGMIICHSLVYTRLASRLRESGVQLLHDVSIPFPLGNWRAEFVVGFRKAVQQGHRLVKARGSTTLLDSGRTTS